MHAGDRHAATEFVGEWYPRIQRWVAAATSAEDIEDYTQAVFLHLAEDGWRRLFQWKGLFAEATDNPQSLASFLKTTTRRKVIDLYRADHPDWLEFLGPDQLPDDGGRARQPQTVQAREQFKLAFRDCFARLQRKDQRMLIMRLKNFTDEEIGEKFGRSKDSVRQRRAQAYKTLRECLAIRAPGQFGDD
jgi:RNA polymerase sigma factor (sigma-70 family)